VVKNSINGCPGMNRKFKYPRELDDQIIVIFVALNEKPCSHDEIINVIKRLAMRYGMAIFLEEIETINEFKKIDEALEFLIREDVIFVNSNGDYELTSKGREEAMKYTKGMYYLFKFLGNLSNPSISPVLSLIIHLFLGILKITGFAVTGSVSLLGDGLDSIMDGISAILIGIAMKIRKEIAATYLLLVLMCITGFGMLVQGIERSIFNPEAIQEGSTALIMAVISIIFCSLLYFYQRYAGYNNRNLTILAQSEDSKNHVLNASLVFLAVVVSSMGVYWIDGVVGCFIGLLILKGALEIYRDLRKQSQGEVIDFEKYKLGIWKRYENLQLELLDLWLLHEINMGVDTLDSMHSNFDVSFKPIIIKHSDRQKHVWTPPQQRKHLDERLQQLVDNNLVELTSDTFLLTAAGKKRLKERLFRKNSEKKGWKRMKRHEKKISSLKK